MKTIKGPDGKVTNVFVTPEGGTNTVYQGIDRATEEVKYIGITQRNPDIRFDEHQNSGTEKSLLRFQEIDGLNNLNRIDARVIEQTLQNGYGMDNLLNIRNSISPTYWENYHIPKSW